MLQQCNSGNSTTSFSMQYLFPMYSGSGSMDQEPNPHYSTTTTTSSSSASVDCTLSLGTPSTRHTNSTASAPAMLINYRSSSNSLCWGINNITDLSKAQQCCYPTTATAPTFRLPAINPPAAAAASASSSSSNLGGSDPLLLARRCANCDTTSTPLWRNGPRGPKSLCNACGIRYKKEERRSAAAVNLKVDATGYHHRRQQQQYPWNSNPSASSSPWYQNTNEDQHHHHQSPCLSWRLNVIPTRQFDFDRPSLFQYQ